MANNKRKYPFLAMSLLVGLCALSGSNVGCSSSGSSSTAEELGLIPVEVVAPDFTLPTLQGPDISLSDLQGTSVVLNFWAIQCPPCRMELPYFDSAAKEYAGEVAVLAVDIQDSLANLKQFFGDNTLDFIVVLDGNGSVASSYAVRYTPSTFFVDSEGIIRYVKVGPFADEKELQDSIDALLNE